jgi:hypothetical protein
VQAGVAIVVAAIVFAAARPSLGWYQSVSGD